MAASNPPLSTLLQEILKRATVNRAFRVRLLQDPRAAILDEFGIRLIDTFRIKFIEKDPDLDALVVLPDFREDGAIDDDDLGSVVGGTEDPTWSDPPPPSP